MAVNQGIEEELDELCDLACLYLSPAEKAQIAGQLNAILRLVSQIQKVETDGVEPTFYLAAQPVHFRKDQVEPSLHPDQVFRNTVHRSECYFRVPRIAGDEPEKV